MSIGRRKSFPSVTLGTVEAAILAAPSGNPTDGSARYSVTLNLANSHTAAVTVTLKKSDAAGTTVKQILPAASVPNGDFLAYNRTIDLQPGESLRGFASVASVVDVVFDGVEALDS